MNEVALTSFEILMATILVIGFLNEEKLALFEHRLFLKLRRAIRRHRRRKQAAVSLSSRRSVAEKYCA